MASLEQSETEVTDLPSSGKPKMAAWCPQENGMAVSESLPKLKLRKVEQATGAPDILVRIKRTWIHRLYKNHFKQILILRWLIIWGWRTLYPIYTNTIAAHLGSRASKRWRPLVKLGDHVQTLCLPTTKVFDAARVDTPVPTVISDKDQAYLAPPHERYVFPPVYVAELSNSLVYGGTNLVFAQDTVICHDLYDFERDYTSEELHGRHLIDAKTMRMRLLRHDATPARVVVAATFVDACAPNYAHWMTEVLPRIAAFCSVEQFANIPLIINEGLHHNIMESLALISGSEREIIPLPVGQGILVDRLYVTSVAGYVPFERRDEKLAGHSHGLFCPPALGLIRDRISSFVTSLPAQDYPKKIFFRRTSGGRKIVNEIELEEVLLENGFVIIQPEELTFLQQAALLNNSEDIAGPSGAALVNLVLTPANVNCHILIGKFEGTSYWYWQNIACSCGKTVSYIFGELTKGASGIHGDFRVDLKNVIQALRA